MWDLVLDQDLTWTPALGAEEEAENDYAVCFGMRGSESWEATVPKPHENVRVMDACLLPKTFCLVLSKV